MTSSQPQPLQVLPEEPPSPAPVPDAGEKILDIECLRAVAIAYTLIAHYRFMFVEQPRWITWLDGKMHFWGGVDLFFVISGFVISKNLIPKFLHASADPGERLRILLRFWVRRVYRLLPSSWLWVGISLAVVAVVFPGQLLANVYDAFAALLQVYNLHAYSCLIGQATCSHLAVGVYWSLSLEEQFYIFLPILLALSIKRARLVLGICVGLGIAASFLAPNFVRFTRWEGFCIGVLIAWAYTNRHAYRQFDEQFLSHMGHIRTLVALLLFAAIPVVGHGAIVHWSYPMVALCSAGLVVLASYDKNYFRLPKPVRAIGVYLGSRSYSIYLIHVPVLVAFQKLSGGAGASQGRLENLLWVLGATLAILVLSDLNFRFVESRFRNLGRPTLAA